MENSLPDSDTDIDLHLTAKRKSRQASQTVSIKVRRAAFDHSLKATPRHLSATDERFVKIRLADAVDSYMSGIRDVEVEGNFTRGD